MFPVATILWVCERCGNKNDACMLLCPVCGKESFLLMPRYADMVDAKNDHGLPEPCEYPPMPDVIPPRDPIIDKVKGCFSGFRYDPGSQYIVDDNGIVVDVRGYGLFSARFPEPDALQDAFGEWLCSIMNREFGFKQKG